MLIELLLCTGVVCCFVKIRQYTRSQGLDSNRDYVKMSNLYVQQASLSEGSPIVSRQAGLKNSVITKLISSNRLKTKGYIQAQEPNMS
jgi:hypothetical protein